MLSVSLRHGLNHSALAARLTDADPPLQFQDVTPLHFAAQNDNTETVRALVELKATVDAKTVSVGQRRGRGGHRERRMSGGELSR
jgi:hypothetical protein